MARTCCLVALILHRLCILIRLIRLIFLTLLGRRSLSPKKFAQQLADHWSGHGTAMGHFAGRTFIECGKSIFWGVSRSKSDEPRGRTLLLLRSPLSGARFTGNLDILQLCGAN